MSTTPRALVLGVNGQDGSYIAEVLLERGYQVTGIARQTSSRWVNDSHFDYIQLDATDVDAFDNLLSRTMPDQIYHMAVIHGAAGHFYERTWQQALALNVGSVHTCLEHMRQRNPATRLFYPSSLKAFGDPPPSEIDEATPRIAAGLYSITKNAATDLIHHYRKHHNAWASVGYYFNHDSPRRPSDFFLPRLAAQIAASLRPDLPATSVASLDFWCDWGSSREFMELTVDLVNSDTPQDVVIASGRPVYAADLARRLVEGLGAPPLPSPPLRSHAAPPMHAKLDELLRITGRLPRNGALEVARWILAERYGLIWHEQDIKADRK